MEPNLITSQKTNRNYLISFICIVLSVYILANLIIISCLFFGGLCSFPILGPGGPLALPALAAINIIDLGFVPLGVFYLHPFLPHLIWLCLSIFGIFIYIKNKTFKKMILIICLLALVASMVQVFSFFNNKKDVQNTLDDNFKVANINFEKTKQDFLQPKKLNEIKISNYSSGVQVEHIDQKEKITFSVDGPAGKKGTVFSFETCQKDQIKDNELMQYFNGQYVTIQLPETLSQADGHYTRFDGLDFQFNEPIMVTNSTGVALNEFSDLVNRCNITYGHSYHVTLLNN